MSVALRQAQSADTGEIIVLNRVVQAIHAAADQEFFRTAVDEDELTQVFAKIVSSKGRFVSGTRASTIGRPREWASGRR